MEKRPETRRFPHLRGGNTIFGRGAALMGELLEQFRYDINAKEYREERQPDGQDNPDCSGHRINNRFQHLSGNANIGSTRRRKRSHAHADAKRKSHRDASKTLAKKPLYRRKHLFPFPPFPLYF
jgi:hypothetical protein